MRLATALSCSSFRLYVSKLVGCSECANIFMFFTMCTPLLILKQADVCVCVYSLLLCHYVALCPQLLNTGNPERSALS